MRDECSGAEVGFLSGWGGGASEILPTSRSRVMAAAKILASKLGVGGPRAPRDSHLNAKRSILILSFKHV